MEKRNIESIEFDTIWLKQCYPLLNSSFGFTYDEICDELAQIITKKFLFTDEDKTLKEKCKNQDGKIDAVKFGLESGEPFHIPVTEGYSAIIKNIQEYCAYRIPNELHEKVIISLIFIACLYNRNKNNLFTDGYNDYYQSLLQYSKEIRPNLLKLCIILHSPRRSNQPIKISCSEQQPVKINNENSWLFDQLDNLVKKYAGELTVEQAKKELKENYSDHIGRKPSNPELNYLIYGTWKLLNLTAFPSSDKVTTQQSGFIRDFLCCMGLIDHKSKLYELNTLGATIRSLHQSQTNPIQRHMKQMQYAPMLADINDIYR